jgi:putative nucleotidyltransferase with HDIG domain
MEWIDWVGAGGWQSSPDAVPMVPAVAREVLEFSTDPDVPAKRIANVVSKDPVLATRVLQLANSAFSASAVEIGSINDAVVRMGTVSVRHVVTAVCVASILADKGAYGDRGRDLIDHGIGTAYLAWLIADAAGTSRDEAFVCGLLHDIGKLLIQQLAHRPPAGVKKPAAIDVSAVMAARHAELGGHLLRSWQLPAALSDAVTFHHEPDRTAGAASGAAVAYAANRLAHQYGFGCPPEDFDPLADPIFAGMGIEAVTLARIDQQARGMYEAARRLTA